MAFSKEESIAEDLISSGYISFDTVNASEGFWVRISEDNLPNTMSLEEPPKF